MSRRRPRSRRADYDGGTSGSLSVGVDKNIRMISVKSVTNTRLYASNNDHVDIQLPRTTRYRRNVENGKFITVDNPAFAAGLFNQHHHPSTYYSPAMGTRYVASTLGDNVNSTNTYFRSSNDMDYSVEHEYIRKFGTPPGNKRWVSFADVNVSKLNELFCTELKEQFGQFEVSFQKSELTSYLESENKKERAIELVWCFATRQEKVLVSMMYDIYDSARVIVFSDNADSQVIEWLNEFEDKNKGSFKIERPSKPTINIITVCGNALDVMPFELAQLENIDSFVGKNYNDDFQEVAEAIVHKAKNGNKGITLLHGERGTGKTNFIRYIANKVTEKDIIYVPPDMASQLTRPEFIPFVMDHKDSIFIVEDAETILKTREGGGNSAVANLLNLSDGIIGDAIRCQFICTFNCQFGDIDSALTRKGRLNVEWEFKRLSKEKSQRLLDEIYGEGKHTATGAMALADIYNFEDQTFHKDPEKRRVGFVQ